MDLRELILAQNVETSRNAMSNSLRYITAKLRDSDSCPTIGYGRSVPVIHVSSHSICPQILMRIAESSVLEFGFLVRKILSALSRSSYDCLVHFLHRRRPPPLLSPPPCHFLPGRVGFIGPGVRDSFIRRVFGPDLRVPNVQLPSPVSKGQNESYIFHGPFRGYPG